MKEQEVKVVEHNSDKIGKGILGIGGILSLVVLFIRAVVRWSQYDIWGKIEFTMFAFFVIYVFGYLYVTSGDPLQSKVMDFSHPLPNIFFATLLLLMVALMVVYVLSGFHIRFQYTNILQFFTLLLFDGSAVFVIPKVIHQKSMKGRSAT